MHLIVKNLVGYCTVTFVWGWKIVCVQESCLFIYIVYSIHCQVDTTCMYILSNNSHTFTDTNMKFTA